MSFIYITDYSSNDMHQFLTELSQYTGPIKLDTETTSLNIFSAKLLLLQIKLKNTYIFNCQTLDDSQLKDIIWLIKSTNRIVIFHNAKYDLKILYNNFRIMLENVYDTMWMEVLINQGVGQKLYSLEDLVFKYCNVQLDKSIRKSFYENNTGNITQEQLIYSAQDVEYLEYIRDTQLEMLKKAGEMKIVKLENRLTPVVAEIEYNGIYLNKEDWTKLNDENQLSFQKQEHELKSYLIGKLLEVPFTNALEFADRLNIPVKTKRDREALVNILDPNFVLEWALEKFNLGSSKQVLTAIKMLGVDVPSTNEKVLSDHKNKHEFIASLLNYREFDKKLTTYGLSFLDNIKSETGRVHTELMNLGADSGRFSSQNPNLQNIPRDKRFRECFMAPEGKLLLSTDYSQQEYRLAGAVTKERRIIDAYLAGKDMHTATAALVNNKSMEEVTKQERQDAKTINFAILYGSTEYGLSFNMGIPVKEAKSIVDAFYNGYPTLAKVKSAIEDRIIELKYSVTLMGRRRYWKDEPDFSTPQEIVKYKNRMKREGFNHIIQGGGADITKLALVELHNRNPFGDKFKMVLQVHDEIVAEIDESIKEPATEFMESIMKEVEQPFLGEIPAAVESHVDKRWSK